MKFFFGSEVVVSLQSRAVRTTCLWKWKRRGECKNWFEASIGVTEAVESRECFVVVFQKPVMMTPFSECIGSVHKNMKRIENGQVL